jgi:hypothetical protein
MTLLRFAVLLALGVSALGCASAHKVVSLRADARTLGGNEAVAKVEAPGGWYHATRRAERAELAAPDNFSKMSFSVSPVVVAAEGCAELAKRAASDQAQGAAGSTGAKPEFTVLPESPDTIDYQLTVPASPPGPYDRLVQGRAMCRNGALAVVTCSTGVKLKATGAECQKVLASLTIEALTPVPAKAPEVAPVAPAPAANP